MQIVPARAEHAQTLSEIALRSKAHWGYSDAFMRACRDELTVSTDDINNPAWRIEVAFVAGKPAGFYTLAPDTDQSWELHALFVEPRSIGQGIGAALFAHAIAALKRLGASALTIQSDPDAEGFYLAQGARRVGETASGSIPDRILPQLEVVIAP